jgi:hypothetical protein
MDIEGRDSQLCVVGLGSAGWVLRPQGSSGEAQLSRCARGGGCDRFQRGLRTHPADALGFVDMDIEGGDWLPSAGVGYRPLPQRPLTPPK